MADGEVKDVGSAAVGAPLHLGQVPGRRISASHEPRDHHRPLVRPRHGAGRGHGVAQARQDHRPTTRRHIQDLGSTNGTFVNGEKIRKAELKDGDRILIGTSIIKIVAVDGDTTSQPRRETEARSKMAVAANKRHGAAQVDVGQHRGDPAARPAAAAVDQPQVGRAGRSHSDRARRARSSCARGRSTSPTSRTSFDIGPRKAIVRMLAWTQGSFELEPPDETPVLEEMQESTEALLMEGMRQLDEYRVQLEKLPAAVVARSASRARSSRSCATSRPRSWTCSRRRSRSRPSRRCSTSRR